uniref:Uncharacterized protein n=1 Tax=Anopheles merus TaxID=30066 RepID=A0A182V094_ANOME
MRTVATFIPKDSCVRQSIKCAQESEEEQEFSSSAGRSQRRNGHLQISTTSTGAAGRPRGGGVRVRKFNQLSCRVKRREAMLFCSLHLPTVYYGTVGRYTSSTALPGSKRAMKRAVAKQ